MLQTINRDLSIAALSSYMRVFIEPHLKHVRWETRLQEFRKQSRKSYYGSMWTRHDFAYLTIFFACFIAGVIFTVAGIRDLTRTQTIISINGIALWTIISLAALVPNWYRYRRFMMVLTMEWDEVWLQIANQERNISEGGELNIGNPEKFNDNSLPDKSNDQDKLRRTTEVWRFITKHTDMDAVLAQDEEQTVSSNKIYEQRAGETYDKLIDRIIAEDERVLDMTASHMTKPVRNIDTSGNISETEQ